MLAKILASLSQAQLIVCSPGPGGGYALSRAPHAITFQQVADVFEREDPSPLCPFGGGICGVGKNCALHDKLVEVKQQVSTFLEETTFEIFRAAAQEGALAENATVRPPKVDPTIVPTEPRESFRVRKRRPV
ncbi:MAG: hypothetical protein EXS03_06700 [Phycisphaerales bacterium]|nr:hypothetical protein [Phycisphaerales bacterium]